MNVASSRGDIASGTLLRSAIRVRSRGSASAALISAWSLSTMSAGVLAGAPIPNHELTS
jgi:polyribonucleotide nucleotidyltransferase